MNIQVASRVSEQLKTYDLRKLGNFKEIPEMFGIDGKYPAGTPKDKFWQLINCKNSAVKHSIVKSILLDFMNLPAVSCPRFRRMSAELYAMLK